MNVRDSKRPRFVSTFSIINRRNSAFIVVTVSPASLTFPDESHYVLDFRVPRRLLAGDAPVELRVTFDTHFVPKQLGMNEDTRELVVWGPGQIELHRTAGPGMTGKLDQTGPVGDE